MTEELLILKRVTVPVQGQKYLCKRRGTWMVLRSVDSRWLLQVDGNTRLYSNDEIESIWEIP